MQSKIKVLLIEDHPEYREVIDLALRTEIDIDLVGQVGSAERALSILQRAEPAQVPDLILLDLNLPGTTGLCAIPAIRSLVPQTRIIILTQSSKESDVMCAIQRGAYGYLLKSSTAAQVVDAIRTVGAGGALLGKNVAKFVLDSFQGQPQRRELQDVLSPREMEILSLLGEGLGKKEVAHHLNISINTVATHIRRIYEKLDVQNAPAAITKAFRSGIFSSEKEDQ